MFSGIIGFGSCIGRGACGKLNGVVGTLSCQGYSACMLATNRIGNKSCNGTNACLSNHARIGDCLCIGNSECKNNTTPMNFDGCVPSNSPTCNYNNAKKIKLQSNTGMPIHLFQLQVISSSGDNVALGKTSTQSSTLGSFTALKAVDGNQATFSHTNDANAWLEVDLGGIFSIRSVVIVNRWCKEPSDPSACLCRLSYASLVLVDNLGTEISSISTGNTCGLLSMTYEFDRDSRFCIGMSVLKGMLKSNVKPNKERVLKRPC